MGIPLLRASRWVRRRSCAALEPPVLLLAALALTVQLTPGVRAAPPRTSITLFVQPGAGAAPLLGLIRDAHASIRLEVYLLTNRSIVAGLRAARARGVDVRVLLEQHPYRESRYANLGHSLLEEAGISVRWANENAFRLTHEKALTVDGQIAAILTSNLTSSGIERNREFGVIEHNTNDARTIAAIFDADWSRQPVHLTDPRLAVSPVTARRSLTRLIDRTARSLDLYAEEVNDPAIEQHLVSAVRRGVHVRLMTSRSSRGTQFLQRDGVSVRISTSPYIHAKAIVADGRRFFVGSENLSTASLDDNREVGIILTDQRTATVVEQTFADDWKMGLNPSR